MSIKLENVSHIYMPKSPYERVALDNVTLEIAEGSFTAIAGHTGSGKSTLLQHLNGLIAPTSGKVLVDGVDINSIAKADKKIILAARHLVGMVFQYPEQQLFEETVAKDIAFGPIKQGLTNDEVTARVRESMELVGLDYEKFKDKSPFSLSGGQMRRVAIAGVLALKPKYLVLDEPSAGLDPVGRERLIAAIEKLHKKQKMTIILVSHSMEDIARLASSVIIMAQGRMLMQDKPLKIFKNRELLAKAGLSAPHIMTLMEKLNNVGLKVNTEVLTVKEGIKAIKEGIARVK